MPEKTTIYVRLIGEGTLVYRPVEAIKVGNGKFRLLGAEAYDSDVEEWEFLPGVVVNVEEKVLSGQPTLVAVAADGLHPARVAWLG